jgi:glycosyltransferase involved in cell wall biosynthesis
MESKPETSSLKQFPPLVSVVIPVYNRTVELERAIRSVLSQTWQNFEIIVADDGSDMDIKAVCDSFHDTRIRFVRCVEHKNANVARNKGTQAALGKYIAMLDSDDEFLPEHIERRIQKLSEWDCDGIFGSIYFGRPDGRELRLSRPRYENESMLNYLLSDGFAPTPTHFYRTTAALEILWDENLTRHQDYDFSVRFSEKFKFLSDYEPSVIVNHTPFDERKEINLDSCIDFIHRHQEKIYPAIYNSYHRRMYMNFRSHHNKNYVRHYAQNSYRHIQFVSFADFMYVHDVTKKFDLLIFIKFIGLHLLDSYQTLKKNILSF